MHTCWWAATKKLINLGSHRELCKKKKKRKKMNKKVGLCHQRRLFSRSAGQKNILGWQSVNSRDTCEGTLGCQPSGRRARWVFGKTHTHARTHTHTNINAQLKSQGWSLVYYNLCCAAANPCAQRTGKFLIFFLSIWLHDRIQRRRIRAREKFPFRVLSWNLVKNVKVQQN